MQHGERDGAERVINMALLAILALVVLLATIDLGWIIQKDILTPNFSVSFSIAILGKGLAGGEGSVGT